jgi:hypothetical protein
MLGCENLYAIAPYTFLVTGILLEVIFWGKVMTALMLHWSDDTRERYDDDTRRIASKHHDWLKGLRLQAPNRRFLPSNSTLDEERSRQEVWQDLDSYADKLRDLPISVSADWLDHVRHWMSQGV